MNLERIGFPFPHSQNEDANMLDFVHNWGWGFDWKRRKGWFIADDTGNKIVVAAIEGVEKWNEIWEVLIFM